MEACRYDGLGHICSLVVMFIVSITVCRGLVDVVCVVGARGGKWGLKLMIEPDIRTLLVMHIGCITVGTGLIGVVRVAVVKMEENGARKVVI